MSSSKYRDCQPSGCQNIWKAARNDIEGTPLSCFCIVFRDLKIILQNDLTLLIKHGNASMIWGPNNNSSKGIPRVLHGWRNLISKNQREKIEATFCRGEDKVGILMKKGETVAEDYNLHCQFQDGIENKTKKKTVENVFTRQNAYLVMFIYLFLLR